MRVFDRETNELRTLRKAKQMVEGELFDKENITGLKTEDSPEFADVHVTSLAADGVLGNVAKSIKSYLTQLWAKLTAHAGLTTSAHGGIVATTDPRLSDSRPPAAHKSSHATGGSDALSPADIGAISSTEKGAANGVAPLGADSKISTAYLPAAVLGALEYQGTWNASSNSPAIPAASSGNKGYFYKVSVAGSTSIDGISDWQIGDWIVSNGAAWDKVDNTDLVSSVAGKTGAVTLTKSDVGLGSVDNTSDADKPVSTATQTAINAVGTWTDVAFNAGDFGNMTVASGDMEAFQYTIIGKTMFINFQIVTATISGSPGTVTIKIPAGKLPRKRVIATSVWIYNGGTFSGGFAEADPGAANLVIYRNFSMSAFANETDSTYVRGTIYFEIQ